MPRGYMKNISGIKSKKKLGGSSKKNLCTSNHHNKKNCSVCNGINVFKKRRLGQFSEKLRRKIVIHN